MDASSLSAMKASWHPDLPALPGDDVASPEARLERRRVPQAGSHHEQASRRSSRPTLIVERSLPACAAQRLNQAPRARRPGIRRSFTCSLPTGSGMLSERTRLSISARWAVPIDSVEGTAPTPTRAPEAVLRRRTMSLARPGRYHDAGNRRANTGRELFRVAAPRQARPLVPSRRLHE